MMLYCCCLVTKSCLTLVTPWTIAYQALLSTGFSRQEYWSGLLFPSPGDLPDPGIEPRSPAWQADSLLSLQGCPCCALSKTTHPLLLPLPSVGPWMGFKPHSHLLSHLNFPWFCETDMQAFSLDTPFMNKEIENQRCGIISSRTHTARKRQSSNLRLLILSLTSGPWH